MTSRQDHIRQVFDDLLEGEGDPGQRVRTRVDQCSPISVYAARTFPERRLLLEIGPIRKAFLPAGFSRPRIKGLNIVVDSHSKAGGGEITLLLELKQSEASGVFITFVALVCEELDDLNKPADAVRAVIAVVERWKKFFAGNSESLNDTRQTGLYGELHMMARLHRAHTSIASLVSAWTGSKRTDQDFEFGDVSIEVKSTTAVDATNVSITNIRQLDGTGLEHLFLARVSLDARQGANNTLPDLVNYLRAEIARQAPEASLDFEEKLLCAKYREEHVEHYSNRAYTERALDLYEVRDGFPRLQECDLPTGVTKATYDITVEFCEPFKKPCAEVFSCVSKCCD